MNHRVMFSLLGVVKTSSVVLFFLGSQEEFLNGKPKPVVVIQMFHYGKSRPKTLTLLLFD